jgi:hypothetical protein
MSNYSVRSINSIFDSSKILLDNKDSRVVWHHQATCYFNLDLSDCLTTATSNPGNLLEILDRDNKLSVIDLSEIDSTPNHHLNELSRNSGLPLSVIFGFSVSKIETLLRHTYFPDCLVLIQPRRYCTSEPILFDVYKSIKLHPDEHINVQGGSMGRRIKQESKILMGNILEGIDLPQDWTTCIYQDQVIWTHPDFRFDNSRDNLVIYASSNQLENMFPKKSKPNILDWLGRIGKPEQKMVTYFKVIDRYLYLVRTTLEAYSYH